jgi:YegS/Rv2252/BmrU family lipid kinase
MNFMSEKKRQSKRKLLLTINPVSGKGTGKKYAFALITLFSKEGFMVTARPTVAEPEENIKFIKENAPFFDLVVCCGGDGTLNQTITGLIQSQKDVPLGYIPLGTTNDFAKTLGISSDPIKAACGIIKGKKRRIDCGLFNDKNFAYVAAAGAFTEASYGATSAEKNILGSFAYIIKGIESLAKIKPFHVKVKADDKIIEGDYLYTSVSNSTSLGGMFKLDPSKVKIDDGVFELILIKNPKNITEKRKLITGLLSDNLDSDYVDLIYAKEIKFKFNEKQPWSLDGESGGEHKEIKIINLYEKITMIGISK